MNEAIGEVVIGEGDTGGWTVVKWFDKTPPLGTKLYASAAPPLGQSADVRDALRDLCCYFPTDMDMHAARWDQETIDAACNAYDRARAALAEQASPSFDHEQGAQAEGVLTPVELVELWRDCSHDGDSVDGETILAFARAIRAERAPD